MKKILLAIGIGLLGFTSQAQITAGVHAKISGYKLSEPSRDYLTSLRPGFEFGAFTRFDLSRTFYVQPELGFSYIGGNIRFENVDYERTYKASAMYIPVFIGAKLVQMPDVNFRVYLGLGNTIPILNNIKIANDAAKEFANSRGLQYQAVATSSSYEISGLIGIGFDLQDVVIDMRYGRGFNQAVTIKNNGKSDKFYQNMFTLSIGYKMIKAKQ